MKEIKRKHSFLTPMKTPRQTKKQNVNITFSPTLHSTPMQSHVKSPVKSPVIKESRKKLIFDTIIKNKNKRHQRGSVAGIVSAVNHSRYYTAYKHMISRGGKAKSDFLHAVADIVRNEIAKFCKNNTSFPKLENIGSLQTFSWSKLIDTFKEHLPTLTTAIIASMTKRQQGNANHYR